ncbi:Transcriptional regulator [Escherichia coli]|nr:Transcriptional regulator [Escherichia coli]
MSAGALNAKVGVMLLVELLTTSLIALDHKYSDVSQQTASATLRYCFKDIKTAKALRDPHESALINQHHIMVGSGEVIKNGDQHHSF